jgi:hypothetical protein
VVTVTAGDWSFSLPDDWAEKASDEKTTYIEAPDKVRGVYIQAMVPVAPTSTAMESADAIQGINIESYSSSPATPWKIGLRRSVVLDGYCTSVMDIMDPESMYRIRFVVICGPGKGLRLAIHDYYCDDYDDTTRFFDEVEQSIEGNLSAA